jgi:hypothetical protein
MANEDLHVTILNEIKCEVCKHEQEVEVLYTQGRVRIRHPDDWTVILQETCGDVNGLVAAFYCPLHTPADVGSYLQRSPPPLPELSVPLRMLL